MSVSCRFYKHRYPKQEDVVMVNVRSIAEMGAYVTLLEYNNIEGMIMLSELSRRRIRSINKLVRIGRNECVVVIRVDETKGKDKRVRTVFLIDAHLMCFISHCYPRGQYTKDSTLETWLFKIEFRSPLCCLQGILTCPNGVSLQRKYRNVKKSTLKLKL